MSDLPHGWTEVTLGDIAVSVKNGIFISRPKNDPDGVPILRISSVRPLRLDLSDIRYSAASVTSLESSNALLQESDLLFTRYNGNPEFVGACARVPTLIGPLTYPDKLIRVRIDERLRDSRFVMYAFAAPAVRDQVRSLSGSTAGQVGISGRSLRRVRIPLPPLDEQDRIVAVLEDYLSRIDAAVVSTLAAAGKAVALRRRILANLVSPDSSGSWNSYRLEDVTTTVRNGMFVSRPGHEPNGVPILRISAVRSLALDLSDLRYTAKSPEVVQRESYLLRGGDLLFTRYNGNPEYVGACAVVPENLEPLTYPDKLIRVSPDRSLVDPVYLAMTCSAGESRQAIRSAVKTTAGQAGISGSEIKGILLHLPDLDEQRRRAAEFQEHNEAVRCIEKNVRSVIRRGDYLRRSLLNEAFAGGLVPQDPAEEPASVLLERIRAARAAQLRARRTPRTAMHAPQEETLL